MIIRDSRNKKHRWHRTYAIFPVYTIKGRRVCLDYVYKREFWYDVSWTHEVETGVEYGDIFDVLTNPDELD